MSEYLSAWLWYDRTREYSVVKLIRAFAFVPPDDILRGNRLHDNTCFPSYTLMASCQDSK